MNLGMRWYIPTAGEKELENVKREKVSVRPIQASTIRNGKLLGGSSISSDEKL